MAKTLAQWMRENGISDQVLAAQLGVSRSTVSRLRRGVTKPSWDLIPALKQRTKGAVTSESFVDERPRRSSRPAMAFPLPGVISG
jgi:transcriptional regulator with XRE-family HTH domain